MEKERICCVCRKKDLASNRIRICRQIDSTEQTQTYQYFIDHKGNANGRGAYLCHSCIDQAIKKRALNRTFKNNIPNELYAKLEQLKAKTTQEA